jgi:hypothetical protein
LGFLRIEFKNNDDNEYVTDLFDGCKLKQLVELDDILYCINDVNPYCAFWIYDKSEFNRFVNSKYYDINNIMDYEIREKSAIGLHGISNYWYRGTLIPITKKTLHEKCKIFHLPNNYAIDNNSCFAKIKFKDAIDKSAFVNDIIQI